MGWMIREPWMTSFRHSRAGFTLVELLIVSLLLGILATISLKTIGLNTDTQIWEQTKTKMEAIRTAILGDDRDLDNEGNRKNFGYHGDMGKLPAALTNLLNAETPAWSFNSTYGFGAGWRGPYVSKQVTGGVAIDKDGWGQSFIYLPAASPPSLTSYGSDNAAGGTGTAKDIVITFPTQLRFSTVRGHVLDGVNRISGKTVEIRYPVAGTITAFTTTSDVDGFFSFANVPFRGTVAQDNGAGSHASAQADNRGSVRLSRTVVKVELFRDRQHPDSELCDRLRQFHGSSQAKRHCFLKKYLCHPASAWLHHRELDRHGTSKPDSAQRDSAKSA